MRSQSSRDGVYIMAVRRRVTENINGGLAVCGCFQSKPARVAQDFLLHEPDQERIRGRKVVPPRSFPLLNNRNAWHPLPCAGRNLSSAAYRIAQQQNPL